MEIRYISKVEGDKVVLTSLTRAVPEEEITVDVTELNELRKQINIYGFNAVTGSIKVLTKKDALDIYKSKLKLIGQEYSPDAEVEVTDIRTVKNVSYLDITIRKDLDHSRYSPNLVISWKDIFEALSRIDDLNCAYGNSNNTFVAEYNINLIFDFGMYEEITSALFFKSQVREFVANSEYSDFIIKSIKFSDNVDFKYTKVLSAIFDPLVEFAGMGYVKIAKDCVADFSKFTLERIENMIGLLRCSNGLNMLMPTIKAKKLPNMYNMIAKPTYEDYKILTNNLKFAKEYCQDGFYAIADDFARVKKLKLSNIKSILKCSTKGTSLVTIAVNELVLDCELTENIFKDTNNLRFTVENLIITDKFSISGYSKEKAENIEEFFTIKDDSGISFKVYEINSKDTVFSETSKKFLETGIVPESIINCFKGYELCPVISLWTDKRDYWKDFYKVCDVKFKQSDNIDFPLAMTLISLITQENFYLSTEDGDYCNSENAPTDMGFYIKAKKK